MEHISIFFLYSSNITLILLSLKLYTITLLHYVTSGENYGTAEQLQYY
jgi:hypothetical protein